MKDAIEKRLEEILKELEQAVDHRNGLNDALKRTTARINQLDGAAQELTKLLNSQKKEDDEKKDEEK